MNKRVTHFFNNIYVQFYCFSTNLPKNKFCLFLETNLDSHEKCCNSPSEVLLFHIKMFELASRLQFTEGKALLFLTGCALVHNLVGMSN